MKLLIVVLIAASTCFSQLIVPDLNICELCQPSQTQCLAHCIPMATFSDPNAYVNGQFCVCGDNPTCKAACGAFLG
ncbi:hypothetical protein Btru_000409 [Bulinus truncatus]|nr:hypothetical protein Btru_000409 [Bulinus truncatus]